MFLIRTRYANLLGILGIVQRSSISADHIQQITRAFSAVDSRYFRAPQSSLVSIVARMTAYLMAFSTNFCSNFATSLLNVSTCSQQSSGLRSFILKHPTISSFAFSTAGSIASSFFLFASLLLSSAISFETLSCDLCDSPD